MKPQRLTKAPENGEDDDPHSPSSNRVSDLAGADKMSYQVRKRIENDEDKLAMKRDDMPPPWPQRLANPRIQENQALPEFHSKSDKMHRATSDDDFTQARFVYGRSVFPQSVRKTGTNEELFNVQTYQCENCLRTSAWWGATQKRGNYLSVHARIDSTRYVRLQWESNEQKNPGRVLGLQNRYVWIRPTDLSWHLSINAFQDLAWQDHPRS